MRIAISLLLALTLSACVATSPSRPEMAQPTGPFDAPNRGALCDAQKGLDPLKQLSADDEVRFAKVFAAPQDGQRLGDVAAPGGKLREVSFFLAPTAEMPPADTVELVKKFVRLANRATPDPALVLTLAAPNEEVMKTLRSIVEPEVRHCDVEFRIVKGSFYSRWAGLLLAKKK